MADTVNTFKNRLDKEWGTVSSSWTLRPSSTSTSTSSTNKNITNKMGMVDILCCSCKHPVYCWLLLTLSKIFFFFGVRSKIKCIDSKCCLMTIWMTGNWKFDRWSNWRKNQTCSYLFCCHLNIVNNTTHNEANRRRPIWPLCPWNKIR